MKALWRRFRAWREARRKRYAERWSASRPYEGDADKYLSPHPPPGGGPDIPASGGGF